MGLMRRDPRDETVERFTESGAVHIAWRDHSTGEIYGAILRGDTALAALAAEGFGPNEFWPEIR